MDFFKLRDEIQAKVTYRHENIDDLTTKQDRELSAEIIQMKNKLSAEIAKGAKECPDCGNAPMGLLQEVAVNNQIYDLFEIGCVNCANHRSQHFDHKTAIENWNNKRYIAPRTSIVK